MRIQIIFLLLAVSAGLTALPVQDRPPAVAGALPGGPVFAADRPKPPAGSVLDIESLVVVPSDEFRMERRNNFYKKDGSDGLYRWAASGHWSNYDEGKTGGWKKSIPDPLKLNNGQLVKNADTWRNVRYDHIGGHVTTPEETSKYLEMAKKYFKVKPSI